MATAVPSKDQIHSEVRQLFGFVPSWVDAMPDAALPGFWALFANVQLADDTAIPNKYKELIGLAVSGATRCRYCALFHTEAARLFGATDDEIAEASVMGGLTMFASTFLNAMQTDYDQFAAETRKAIEYVKGQAAKAQPRPGEAHA